MNLMTWVRGDADQDLFYQANNTGFPTLAVYDAEGNLLAKHQGKRDVQALEPTMAAAREFQAVLKKAKANDADARALVLAKHSDWGTLRLGDAKAALDDKAIANDLKAKIEAKLPAIELYESHFVAAGKPRIAHFEAMRKGGRMPTDSRGAQLFWRFYLTALDGTGDAGALETGLAEAKKALADDPTAKRILEQFEQRLAESKGKN